MKILFCGLPRSGKSTLGKLLAAHFNLAFSDSDRLLEQAYQRSHSLNLSCRQIFQREGEVAFRALEKEVIHSLLRQEGVIALGGGSLDDESNRQLMQAEEKVIYLKTPLDQIWKRLEAQKETLGQLAYLDAAAPQASFFKRASKRLAFYEAVATLTIEMQELSVQQSLAFIIKNIEK